MTLTVISRTLHLASTFGTRQLPLQLHIRSDNGTGDVKNQTSLKFAAWCVLRGAFTSVTLGQFRPGHSHFRADQSFGTVSTILKSSRKVLEDPNDFQQLLREKCVPTYGKNLAIEKVMPAWTGRSSSAHGSAISVATPSPRARRTTTRKHHMCSSLCGVAT